MGQEAASSGGRRGRSKSWLGTAHGGRAAPHLRGRLARRRRHLQHRGVSEQLGAAVAQRAVGHRLYALQSVARWWGATRRQASAQRLRQQQLAHTTSSPQPQLAQTLPSPPCAGRRR